MARFVIYIINIYSETTQIWVSHWPINDGMLQSAVRSRVYPWSNLSNRNLHIAYIAQLSVKYDLDEELLVRRGDDEGLKRNEMMYPDCE